MKRKKVRFPKQPKCEACGKESAFAFTVLRKGGKYTWRFTGECTSDVDYYYAEFYRFFASSAATVDWLAHLSEKEWFNAKDFVQMMWRFRKATESYMQV